LHDTSGLPGLVAFLDGSPVGVLHYRLDSGECEVVTLISTEPRSGAGSGLLDVVHLIASDAGSSRLWLVTTNDNRTAQSFYESRGWRRCAVRPGAMAAARMLKPEIPMTGEGGVPILDEIEYELPIVCT
jgi:hypothetical protein